MLPKEIINQDNYILDIRTIMTIRTKRKRSSYFKQLKPIILALKLFGVMPFITHTSEPVFTLFSWIMLYSLVAGTSMALICFLFPIFWTDMKNIPAYWNRWSIFQDKFELCMRKPFQLNMTKRVWVVTILPTALMTFNIVTSLIFVKGWKVNNAILFIAIFGIINLTTGYFYINCHIFRNVSKDINQRIMELIVTKGSSTRLREYTELWCYMSHLITDFGIVHGGIYCSIAIVIYISSTILWFFFTMTLVTPEKYLVSVIIVPLVFTNSILMVYSEASYIALSEVGKKLQWKILNATMSGVMEQTQREVQDLLETIQHCRTNITFGGFCDVNRELFINFIFAVFFNLVVAFQSQIIPKQYTISLFLLDAIDVYC
ncbi:gustatory and odorant receptor 22 [Melanaphis sacchari]|uniref:gustatory and odorant receptor 22 n=1 Tax=Melanaphis sacchari TaxID=742174 RepID=UPI000DC144BD|nr:gustatory and odorant receptor 22 [Melanaphis sacchari]